MNAVVFYLCLFRVSVIKIYPFLSWLSFGPERDLILL